MACCYLERGDARSVHISPLCAVDGRQMEYRTLRGNLRESDQSDCRISPAKRSGEGVARYSCARRESASGVSSKGRQWTRIPRRSRDFSALEGVVDTQLGAYGVAGVQPQLRV